MPSLVRALAISATFALARAQGVLVSAKGTMGEGAAMAVVLTDSRDANFISQDEIVANIVNACGRTVLKGGISQSGETEKVIASGAFTHVEKGGDLVITVDQRSALGSGPFSCDLDEASNVLGVDGQTNLTVTQDSTQFGTGNLTLTVTMPSDLACIGGSTGNFCTVRCKNANDYGGCLAVQQDDVTPADNDPSTIQSAEKQADIDAQVKQNDADLPAAEKGLASAKSADDVGINIAEQLLKAHSITDAALVASATSTSATATSLSTRTRTGKATKATTTRAATTGSTRTGTGRTGRKGTGKTNGATTNTGAAKAAGNGSGASRSGLSTTSNKALSVESVEDNETEDDESVERRGESIGANLTKRRRVFSNKQNARRAEGERVVVESM